MMKEFIRSGIYVFNTISIFGKAMVSKLAIMKLADNFNNNSYI